ncbi:hypothetical protein WA158_007872 [Blastocystis sp. Blastoise]
MSVILPYTRGQSVAKYSEPSTILDSDKYDKSKLSFKKIFTVVYAIFLWYFFSLCSTILNKTLVSKDIFPITLTFTHVSISTICDLVIINGIKHKEYKATTHLTTSQLIQSILPLSLAMVLTQLFTYISYSLVPVSLTHTVKALQPLFNVIIVYLWTGNKVSIKVVLSLIPIISGVAYSSVNELQFNMRGFIFALLSTLTSVWQSIYVKMLMRYGIDKDYLHLLNGLLSVILLCPCVIIYEYYNKTYESINIKGMILCSLLQYFASIGSYKSLSLISSLTYSILNTFKRVAIIIISALYFGKYLSSQNIFGIVIAVLGVLGYNLVCLSEDKSLRTPRSPQFTPHDSIDYRKYLKSSNSVPKIII